MFTIIDEYPNYRLYSDGRVYNIKRGRFIRPYEITKGYVGLKLYQNGKGRSVKLHRLVANHFLPKVSGKNQINHIDGDKKNNDISNLEWCTNKENSQHAVSNGLTTSGERHPSSKLQVEDVLDIYDSNINISQLSKKYKVDRKTIRNIKQRKGWLCLLNQVRPKLRVGSSSSGS